MALSLSAIITILYGMSTPKGMTDSRVKNPVVNIENEPNLEMHEGYVSQKEETVVVKNDRKFLAKVHLSEPVMVAMAEQYEEWGYFQFPIIGRADDGTLVISWQMKADSHLAYGMNSDRVYTPMMSKDGGTSWIPQDKKYYTISNGYNVRLNNGSVIEVNTPASKNIQKYKIFPQPIVKEGNYSYFKMNTLPDDLQGVYFQIFNTKKGSYTIHSKLIDPDLLRYAIDDMMPLVWWGSIKQLADESLVAGVYPSLYLNEKGELQKSGVSFYRSSDAGGSWSVISKILFNNKEISSVRGEDQFNEPVFEILRDSTFLCVMRTGSATPMYKTFSYDMGKTWTCPVPFTPNGVKPRLLLLNNGVLVLASGRPGVQLRFSIDGRGEKWTIPIDMIPLQKVNNVFVRDVSCGYASIIPEGKDSFYLVYSDFTTKNSAGEVRKSIWFRKVTISVK